MSKRKSKTAQALEKAISKDVRPREIGRPRIFESESDMNNAISDYFAWCDETHTPPTKAGLCLHLDFSKELLHYYITGTRGEQFVNPLKRALLLIETFWNERLHGAAATGAIFYLKTAFWDDYRERSEVDITSKGEKLSAQESSDVAAIAAEVAARLKEQKT